MMKHRLLFFVFLLLFASQIQAQTEIYVSNPPLSSVAVYSATATGNATPVRTIKGNATGLDYPSGIAVDGVNKELYVADFFGRAVHVFSLKANGNVTPLRTLVDGPNSKITQPRTVAIDRVNNEIVVLCGNDSIRVFTRTANGDAVPLRVISGANTLLHNPYDMALDLANNEIIVNSYDVGGFNVPGLLVFQRTANGNKTPLRSIVGNNTQMGTFTNYLTLDPVNNEIIAQGNDGQGVIVFPRTATGNVPPIRNLYGGLTGFSNASAILVDISNNRLIVADMDNNSLSFFHRTATGNTAPLSVISGPATGLSEPLGLATIDSFPWNIFIPAITDKK